MKKKRLTMQNFNSPTVKSAALNQLFKNDPRSYKPSNYGKRLLKSMY